MSIATFTSLLCTVAMFALLACSVLTAFRQQYPPLLRFGPLAVVGVYLVAGLIHFMVAGVASILILPIGCVGLFLGCRMLSRRSALSYTFAASSFVFWPAILFLSARYLMANYFNW